MTPAEKKKDNKNDAKKEEKAEKPDEVTPQPMPNMPQPSTEPKIVSFVKINYLSNDAIELEASPNMSIGMAIKLMESALKSISGIPLQQQ